MRFVNGRGAATVATAVAVLLGCTSERAADEVAPSTTPTPTATSSATAAGSPSLVSPATPTTSAAAPVSAGLLGPDFAAMSSLGRLSVYSKADGRRVRDLEEFEFAGSQIMASADGEQLYFHASAGAIESDGAMIRMPTPEGPAERVLSGAGYVIDLDFNPDGSRVMALRAVPKADAGGLNTHAYTLVEYDTASSTVIRRVPVASSGEGMPSAIAWHSSRDQVASFWGAFDDRAKAYQYSVKLQSLSATRPVVGGMNVLQGACGKHPNVSVSRTDMQFEDDALYVMTLCVDTFGGTDFPARGELHRVTLAGDTSAAQRLFTSPDGTGIAGFHAGPDGLVFATAHRVPESRMPTVVPPTTFYRLGVDGIPVTLFEVDEGMLAFAW